MGPPIEGARLDKKGANFEKKVLNLEKRGATLENLTTTFSPKKDARLGKKGLKMDRRRTNIRLSPYSRMSINHMLGCIANRQEICVDNDPGLVLIIQRVERWMF